MAANRRRGEVAAIIDGRERVLCLTLGALAELEDAFGAEDLGALARRFGSGQLSARDIVRVVGAGLRGGDGYGRGGDALRERYGRRGGAGSGPLGGGVRRGFAAGPLRASPAAGEGATGDAFPWDEAMAAGFGLLRLSPDVFWRMTPREFGQAIRPFLPARANAPTRDALDTLLRRFPDER